ncbi:hypothetical protein FHR84_001506 [Actinopolyspora biskrensis]|uniref:Restriction endonuclease n=1 Tax=Actinopolyspora biskrensis TaxID=1470178 RepID=A0A852YSH8_9ACTN|nr:hypothetical protein [Actinopolyspora biskrensis]NYH78184.1 hypothetical protein [Actinopolyspora biskrensis]
MDNTGAITGNIQLRPARIGFVFWPDMEILRSTIRCLTIAWGGIYCPLISSESPELASRVAKTLDVDALYPLDNYEATNNICEEIGFTWLGRNQSGPINLKEQDNYIKQLATPYWPDLQTEMSRKFIPEWEESDPLAMLFSAWFGEFGESEFHQKYRDKFQRNASVLQIEEKLGRHVEGRDNSPIRYTSRSVYNNSMPVQSGIYVVDPDNPSDLMEYWNTRASGHDVFPLPKRYSSRIMGALRNWVNSRSEEVFVWSSRIYKEENFEVHDVLSEVGKSIDAVECSPEVFGWQGSYHPLSTNFESSFSVSVQKRNMKFKAPINTPFVFDNKDELLEQYRVAAAQISISSEQDVDPRITYSVPNIRSMSRIIPRDLEGPDVFSRPAMGGRAEGVHIGTQDIQLTGLKIENIFSTVFESVGWSSAQTDNGKFASRLIDILGGVESNAANQPGVRAVLDDAARTPKGKPIAALIQSAKNYRGDWPSTIANESMIERYPTDIVYSLLDKRILRPVLPVSCPRCTTQATLNPDELSSDIVCDFCRETFPLGLALGTQKKSNSGWLYRLAGKIPSAQLQETLPVMAAISTLAEFHHPFSSYHNLLGVEVEKQKNPLEIDIAMFVSDRGNPALLIGEAKSYRDDITARDLANLGRMQRDLKESNIECLVLAASFHENFTEQEIEALREFCNNSAYLVSEANPNSPVLPIVLTGPDLSSLPLSEGHPQTWRMYSHDKDIYSLAVESCKRNLGLASFRALTNDRGMYWDFEWK